jgi:methyl-accepting chemotaxis protein
MRPFKLSLFNKLLGFLLLCLVCSGVVAVMLIRGQITHLAHEQMRVLFESDLRNVQAFLQAKADWLLAVARDLAKDELLKTGLELQVFDQVKNLAESRKTTLGLSEVMVINAQKRLVSRGDARRDNLDATVDVALADKAVGDIEFGGRYQIFGQIALSAPDGTLLARVVVMQSLSPAFFQELKVALGKDAMIFAGDREVGSTFTELPGPLRPIAVAPGLFTAFDQRFIGAERDLGDVWGGGTWRVVILQATAPLVQSLRQVQWGSVVFVLLFMSLMALVLGLFFAANIRQPMRLIQQGITALTQRNLATRIHLGRRDEWYLIEEALNGMSTSLAHHETALQRKVSEITALYEIGQEIAAQVDLKAILHLIVERARTLVDAEASLLALRHEASDILQMQAHSGPVPEALATLQLRTGEGLGGRVMATGIPVVVHDYLTEFGDSPVLTVVEDAGVRATVAVPLKTRGHVMGVLYVCSSVPNIFTERASANFECLGRPDHHCHGKDYPLPAAQRPRCGVGTAGARAHGGTGRGQCRNHCPECQASGRKPAHGRRTGRHPQTAAHAPAYCRGTAPDCRPRHCLLYGTSGRGRGRLLRRPAA